MRKTKDVVDFLLEQAGESARVYTTPVGEAVEETEAHEPEGQLAVDIIDTNDSLVVVATVAGASPEEISVYVHNDLLTIRGRRALPVVVSESAFIHRECFWGRFSRTIILPLDVRADGVRAVYKSGVLVVSLPKEKRESRVPITVVDEG
ncbi:MAG: Hsp20/alpha crystallin family protein [Candidatus Magasanikbacteria bacterium]|nr:Hsp20/alpha crystallin family protein [Candidatus Magasanikbacteria bacterium]